MVSTLSETSNTSTSWADQEVESLVDQDDINVEMSCLPCADEFDIEVFKTERCEDEPNSHDSKCCSKFHHRYDRRRLPSGYLPEPCEHEFLQGDLLGGGSLTDDHTTCPFGDQCTKCHNVVELLYHPLVFKRRLCMDMLEKESCPRGALCAFAHSRAELESHATILSEEEQENPTDDFFIFRYKTQWCPLPGVHDWDACMYAHTKRDMRRTPNAGYSMRRCPDWERAMAMEPKDGPSLPYEACCPRGLGCTMAHGVKEVLYHPAVYRMKFCSSADVCHGPRRKCCAFAHCTEELRTPVKTIQDKKVQTCIIEKEQPQFFVPLTFVSFKDSTQKPARPMPSTPSPQAYHREIPADKNTGYCTEQALQNGLQNQAPCPHISNSDPATGPVAWRCCYDANGNMHMWPETSEQQQQPASARCYVWPEQSPLGPTPEAAMMNMHPGSTPCNMPAPYPSKKGCDLRSESMNSWNSWGSATTAQSLGSQKSYATSLRSESMHSWISLPESTCSNTPQVVPPPPKASIFGQLKEKLKPKSKAVVVPRRVK